jgi:hypothetical protein
MLILYTMAKDDVEMFQEVVEDGIAPVLFGGEEVR